MGVTLSDADIARLLDWYGLHWEPFSGQMLCEPEDTELFQRLTAERVQREEQGEGTA